MVFPDKKLYWEYFEEKALVGPSRGQKLLMSSGSGELLTVNLLQSFTTAALKLSGDLTTALIGKARIGTWDFSVMGFLRLIGSLGLINKNHSLSVHENRTLKNWFLFIIIYGFMVPENL